MQLIQIVISNLKCVNCRLIWTSAFPFTGTPASN